MGYGPIKATVGPALEMLYQPWIRGEENIPTEGAAILASNHLAVIDSFFLPLLVDREVAFIGKADYFTGKGVKGWAVKNFMKTVGTTPWTAPAARPPRRRSRPASTACVRGSSSASTPRARAAPTGASTAARPAWLASPWPPEPP